MKVRKTYFAALFLLQVLFVNPEIVSAQIQFGGLAEMEIRKGERDSSPYLNQTPNENWNLFTPRVRLFFFSEISREWYIQGAIQSDYYYSNTLSNPAIVMFSMNWEPGFLDGVILSAGSYPTPFGAYADRVHQSGNAFVQMPILYARSLPVSRQTGLFGEGYLDSYELSLVYRRAYAQGLQVQFVDLEHNTYDIRLAATIMPVSGYGTRSWYDRPSIIGRAMFNPVIWMKTGISFSHGSFMTPDQDTRQTLTGVDFAQYTQTIYAADVELSYKYVRFLTEIGWNRWKVPGAGDKGKLTEGIFFADTWFGLAEIQYNISAVPGLYFGVRMDGVKPEMLNKTAGSLYGGKPADFWAKTTYRYEAVVGRKLNRNLTLKTSYLLTDNQKLNLEDSVFSIQLSASF